MKTLIGKVIHVAAQGCLAMVVVAADGPFTESSAADAPRLGISVRGEALESFHTVTVRSEDARSIVVAGTADRFLDLDALVKDCADDPTARAAVPLGPPLAVGEGSHPDNHTIVRVLSSYGLCEIQFLAYPPEVRGGVGVDCGRFLENGEIGIVAHPLTDPTIRDLRLFNSHGGFARSIALPDAIAPPFAVCAGDFEASNEGDELALASRNIASEGATVLILSPRGDCLRTVAIPNVRPGECGLSGRGTAFGSDELLFTNKDSGTLFVVGPEGRVGLPMRLDGLPPGQSLGPTVFDEDALLAFGPEERLSRVTRVLPSGERELLDVGAKENILWFGPKRDWADRQQTFKEGRYIREGEYEFRGSVSFATQPVRSGRLSTAYADYVNDAFLGSGPQAAALRDYAKGKPKLWAPIMTHRWNRTPYALQILGTVDPRTGLPKYGTLNADNGRVGYVEAAKKESDTPQKKSEFGIGTYAFGIPELEAMYTFPLRGFLKELAKKQRQNPDVFLGVEPNHEHEIVSSEKGETSIGDYNPTFLAGFYRYLLGLEGNLANLNATFGTAFTEDFFDAPRNKGRGAWDAYDEANPYFHRWLEYIRFVVYRRVAQI